MPFDLDRMKQTTDVSLCVEWQEMHKGYWSHWKQVCQQHSKNDSFKSEQDKRVILNDLLQEFLFPSG